MNNQDFFAEALGHWRWIRGGLIAEVENIPDDKFDFRPTPEVKSVRELVQHILEGSMMMVGELTRDDPNFQRQSYPEFLAEFATRAHETTDRSGLISLLKDQLDEGVAAFEAVGGDAMMGTVINFTGTTWSRLQWFFHGLTEEMYHRGQITTYARAAGLVPALTQQIQASSAG